MLLLVVLYTIEVSRLDALKLQVLEAALEAEHNILQSALVRPPCTTEPQKALQGRVLPKSLTCTTFTSCLEPRRASDSAH